ncbi:malonyl-CoA synthase [Aromatoleum toluolicum]|uniref:AMP-binding protein n=1 Tax=Aromatoleum toluolicum TaxID=90060 RepID=A0ABX1NCD1_9RHOO|nr:malonyl-CoA synthase [Aromatoleum toluolicum]NMF96941.1 malonyl-CoA synthase [Aromatoleum toluolicum]
MKNENLYLTLKRGFPADPAALALETADACRYSFSDVDRASARFAGVITSLGLRAGDRVVVQVEKSPEALFLYLACLRAGVVFVPLNTAYQRAELAYFLGDAQPSLVVCRPASEAAMRALASEAGVAHVLTLGEAGDGSLAEAARNQPEDFATVPRAADDLAAILYTSGTTGRSKGAMLTHDNLASNARTLVAYWGFRRSDVLLHALPIFHAHGLFVACHCALLNGSPMLWLPRFDVDTAMKLLPRATVFMGVPTFYTRLLEQPEFDRGTIPAMRLFISGSAPLLAETHREFEERTGHAILERYGMTETVMLTSNPLDAVRRAGTVGFPLPGVNLRIADDAGRTLSTGEIGHVQVRGPNVFPGYWRMPGKTREEFTHDGFFRTGDLGKIDGQGYVVLVGRSKDLIITGGYNVYPKEIESFIDDIAGVKESAVIGLPHRDFGEAVAAVIVRESGAALHEADVIGTLKGELANFKVPKRVFFLDELPRNAMGKVQKNLLRERFSDLAA